MKNWIANTKLNALLDDDSHNLDYVQVRRVLIEYCEKHQETYPFEILDKPLAYLGQHKKSETNHEMAHAELSIAAAEYCFSLNEIAETLLELIDAEHLTLEQVKNIINHIFEAYSCNESPEEFIEREVAYLCEKLPFIITG
ncbi:hypothetical protein G114_01649 [Aeromonas diversa CDC 2478-85]|uniref:Uncharacterized protein n=1 Tax=Aeromonas diversa CDC 2478-85 TaxID=1268237 RepID=N9VQC0_9GAMM|nr:hypothetical protein [Aeromonas diversa]ENY73718.1 hypothetical protein G114_01649 [Aeromonas diversa CDC 2478-85]